MKILMFYSSKTGNTEKLCLGVADALKAEHDIDVKKAKEKFDSEDYDLVIAGFWVDKGTANREALKKIKKIKNKKLLFLGTMGAAPDSDHGRDVVENVAKLVDESNQYLGVFLARGLVAEKLIKRMKMLPLPKHIVEAMYEASITSRPTNDQDVADAVEFVQSKL